MGRPRKYPEGTTGSERARAAEARLREAGGRRLVLNLSPAAAAHLDAAMAREAGLKPTALIERLLAEAAGRDSA